MLAYFIENPGARDILLLLLVVLVELSLQGLRANSVRALLASKSSLYFDLFSWFLHLTSFSVFVSNSITLNALVKVRALSERHSLRFFNPENTLQFIGMFFLALLVFDFFQYWLHRWKHRSNILWESHKFHHSTVNLSAFSNLRVHSLDRIFRVLFVYSPTMFLFGFDSKILFFLYTANGAVEFLEHSRLNVGYGFFGKIFVSPRFHRLHHEAMAPRANYGIVFSFWDRIFHTQKDSRHAFALETGLPGENYESIGPIDAYMLCFFRFFGAPRRRLFSGANRRHRPQSRQALISSETSFH